MHAILFQFTYKIIIILHYVESNARCITLFYDCKNLGCIIFCEREGWSDKLNDKFMEMRPIY